MTTNYAMIGQAFDYLLRFHLQRYNPYAPQTAQWVAGWIKGIPMQLEDEEAHQKRAVEIAALPYLDLSHQHHQQYLEGGDITDDLLGSCLNLAIIDGLVGAGEMRGTLGAIDPKDLQDFTKSACTYSSYTIFR